MYQMKSDRIFGLDCLRALAIGLVILSHCTFLLFPKNVTVVLSIFRLMGAIGVDLFFVLSGYLIGGILLKMMNSDDLNWSKLLRFWKRRWFRTLPNYFLILCVNIVLAFLIGLKLPKETFLYGLFLQNFAWEHPNFFTEAWSLSIEEFAYLLLPLLLFLTSILKKKNSEKLFFLTSLATIVLLTIPKIYYYFNADAISYSDWSLSFRKVVVYRMDSIYYGFLAVYTITYYKNLVQKHKNILFLSGVFMFLLLHSLIFIFKILPETHLWFYSFLYLQVVCISLLLLFPLFLDLKGKGKYKKAIEFVSTRSYAMYLINYSFLLLNLQLFIDVEALEMLVKVCLVLLFLSTTIFVSNLIYVYFEKPILRFRDQKIPR